MFSCAQSVYSSTIKSQKQSHKDEYTVKEEVLLHTTDSWMKIAAAAEYLLSGTLLAAKLLSKTKQDLYGPLI
jgi:hypothetical protein